MDKYEFNVGEYYWVQAGYGWEIVQCVYIPYFDAHIGFEQIGIEGTAYPVKSIKNAIHIPRPVDQ